MPGRPQDLAFVGNIVNAIEAYGRGALGPAAIPLEAVDRIIAIGLGRYDERRRRGAPGGLEALCAARPPGDRVDQLADAVHDEGDLRAVPAAPPRSRDRHRDGRVFLLQPGPGNGSRRFPPQGWIIPPGCTRIGQPVRTSLYSPSCNVVRRPPISNWAAALLITMKRSTPRCQPIASGVSICHTRRAAGKPHPYRLGSGRGSGYRRQ